MRMGNNESFPTQLICMAGLTWSIFSPEFLFTVISPATYWGRFQSWVVDIQLLPKRGVRNIEIKFGIAKCRFVRKSLKFLILFSCAVTPYFTIVYNGAWKFQQLTYGVRVVCRGSCDLLICFVSVTRAFDTRRVRPAPGNCLTPTWSFMKAQGSISRRY